MPPHRPGSLALIAALLLAVTFPLALPATAQDPGSDYCLTTDAPPPAARASTSSSRCRSGTSSASWRRRSSSPPSLRETVEALHRWSGTLGATDYRWFNLRDNRTGGPDLFDSVGLLRDDYGRKRSGLPSCCSPHSPSDDEVPRMSSPADLLLDAFGRLPALVHEAVDGLTEEQLTHRLDPQANTIGWLVWHLARVEDISMTDAFGSEQVWLDDDWGDRLGLPFGPDDLGYGHDSDQVAAVRGVAADLLAGYYDAVAHRTAEHLRFLNPDDLDRVVDRSFDPPVTLGVRLVSVLGDVAQHAGQAALIRGVVTRR